ncbi:type II toxin-antitoxin system RelE/ParE family toxin [Candidatus Gracilibacteria bacterium]|nr:type II toxin-antitoxin system RelE/ParE family toxin [Candidatus Gracilibacteria bacterium]
MKIFFTNIFKKQLKKLKKKFPNVKNDLLDKFKILDLDNEVHIGKGIYKVRIKSSDYPKGKSGGFRSYFYLYKKKNLIVPLCIYHKSQKETITERELKFYFDKVIEELLKI